MADTTALSILTRDEAIVLVTLARALIRADGHVSDPELDSLVDLAHAVGMDVFADAVDRADSITLSTSDLRALAQRVGEPKRLLILETLIDLGASDGLVDPERDLLVALSRLWAIDEPTLR